jgi:DNA-directed RNA polymerase subunit N (RpoN/RPB10)
VLADKWNYYVEECKKLDGDEGGEEAGKQEMKNMSSKARGEILDKLGLKRMCCRRSMLGTVDLMDYI